MSLRIQLSKFISSGLNSVPVLLTIVSKKDKFGITRGGYGITCDLVEVKTEEERENVMSKQKGQVNLPNPILPRCLLYGILRAIEYVEINIPEEITIEENGLLVQQPSRIAEREIVISVEYDKKYSVLIEELNKIINGQKEPFGLLKSLFNTAKERPLSLVFLNHSKFKPDLKSNEQKKKKGLSIKILEQIKNREFK